MVSARAVSHSTLGVALSWALVVGAGCGGQRNDPPHQSRPDAGGSADAGSRLPDGRRVVASAAPARTAQCERDADCSASAGATPRCASLGDYPVCVEQAPTAREPSGAGSLDECDAERPCATGDCYLTLAYASGQCGLGGASLVNLCRADACASDADCGEGLCGPAGLTSESSGAGGFVRQCFEAHCRSEADCSARSGGFCALVESWCGQPDGGTVRPFEPARLACIYPGGCTRSADCPAGATCEVVAGAGVCVTRP